MPTSKDDPSLLAIQEAFDESVVASHIKEHHSLETSVASILAALHTLSEQSYENKALTFGCILDPSRRGADAAAGFPSDFLRAKKFKALSDGYRTAYLVSTNGRILDFVDLQHFELTGLTEKHHYPDWAEPIARASRRKDRCGIALSRQGDVLVFDKGTLRLTYRYGRWQYWNHAHLVNLLRDRAKAQKVPTDVLGRVAGAIYRAALDVSFRRSGGLVVVLHNQRSLRQIVRDGDGLQDSGRSSIDLEFDGVLRHQRIQNLPRPGEVACPDRVVAS